MSEVKLSEIPHLPWFIRGRPLDNGLAVIENGTYEGAHAAECEWHIAHYIVDTLNNQCPAESTSVAEAVEREREPDPPCEAKMPDFHQMIADRDATISRLRAALDVAEGALEPFAKGSVAMELVWPGEPDSAVYETIGPEVLRFGEYEKTADCVEILHGDFRRTRAAIPQIDAALGKAEKSER
jgi:hypothetical protein